MYGSGWIGSEVVWNLLREACFCFHALWHQPFSFSLLSKTKRIPAPIASVRDPKDPSRPHNKSYPSDTHTHTHTPTQARTQAQNSMYAHNEIVYALADTPMNTRLHLSAHLHTWVTGDLKSFLAAQWSLSGADDPLELLYNSWFCPPGHSRRTEAQALKGAWGKYISHMIPPQFVYLNKYIQFKSR